MRVLVTRPKDDAAPLMTELKARGIDAVLAPLLTINFFDGSLLDLSGVQALLMSSANGVRAFAGRSGNRALPLVAVGDATARVAKHKINPIACLLKKAHHVLECSILGKM